MIKETWKAIPGYEGLYEVSDLGRVRSLDREVTHSNGRVRHYKGQIMKQYITDKGKPILQLRKDLKNRGEKVHALVARTFIGERPEGYEVCHINGNPQDNRLENLKYDTSSQNSIDMYRYGGKAGKGKLSIEQVLEIRKLYTTKRYYQYELAEMFGIKQSSINSIVNRKTFKWLNDDGTIDESQTAVS